MKKSLFLSSLFFLIFLNLTFAQDLSVSGQVLRHNGDPMPNVKVTCSNGDSILTDQNGFYQFSNLAPDEDYHINATYYTDLFNDLTVLDAAVWRYMILEIIDYSSAQWIALDFDQFGQYSNLDYLRLIQAALKIESPTSPYYAEDHPWRFFDTAIEMISNLEDVETGINLENLSSSISNLNLIGVKSGDPAIDEDYIPPPPTAPNPLFYLADMTLTSNTEIILPIKARDLGGIMAWQHAINWDTSFLEYISHEGLIEGIDLSFNEETVENGLLRMMGVNIFISEVEDDSTIYEIRFNVLQDANNLSDIIDFDSLAIANQVVYFESNEFYLIEAEFSIGEPMTSGIDELTNLISFELSPNPAFEYVQFSIQLEQEERAIVSLFNSMGKLVQEESFDTQLINGKMDISRLAKGIYHLRIQTSDDVSSRSFVKK